MPIFKTKEEAINAHKVYTHDTDNEAKFDPTYPKYPRAKKLMDLTPQGSVVLDVGCNTGGFGRLLMQKKRCTVYGLDVCEPAVEVAKQKGILARLGEAENMPFSNNYFDVVILGEILEHVYDPKPVVDEAVRVLKIGGLFMGSVPHYKGENAKKGVEDHPYHARIFGDRDLRRLFYKHFGIYGITYHDIYLNPPRPLIPQWKVFCGKTLCLS